ncbi:MAG: hypothetical protein AAGD25_02600 [Cyanobacteria bacterium P01_F01_bin.150]
MIKYKWFFVDWSVPISLIGSMMLASQFTEEAGEGFIISRSNSSSIEGKFIQKNIYYVSEERPFGENIRNQRIEYMIIEFNITNGRYLGLELLNPPRTIKPLISKLSEMIGLGLIITDSLVNPLHWAEQIEKQAKSFKLTEMQVSDVGIASNSLARISVSGECDIRKDFSDFIGNKKYSVQQVKFRVKLLESEVKSCLIELKKNGSAKFYSGWSVKLYSLVRNSLDSQAIR